MIFDCIEIDNDIETDKEFYTAKKSTNPIVRLNERHCSETHTHHTSP